MTNSQLQKRYLSVRRRSEVICRPLKTEDYVVQPIPEVSPPKWHLGHTTWFFETFILKEYLPGYQTFNDQYDFVFNSYYETLGARVIRTDRGNLSRPTVEDIFKYREYVDAKMLQLLSEVAGNSRLNELTVLGLNHEQQHQELLATDIKYILGHNPLLPEYSKDLFSDIVDLPENEFVSMAGGLYQIGFTGDGFCFDNELPSHRVYLKPFQIARYPVKNADYLEFMNDGGYQDFRYWHSEGWEWVKARQAKAPLYWYHIDGVWKQYTFGGLDKVNPSGVLYHVNFFEASAFAAWKGMRLPTETEWEVAASGGISWGYCWEWTGSAYLPYPGYKQAPGALGEYNGKFMVNQMVLRGASVVTPAGHSRPTYRNFFHTHQQWQFSGVRLVREG